MFRLWCTEEARGEGTGAYSIMVDKKVYVYGLWCTEKASVGEALRD